MSAEDKTTPLAPAAEVPKPELARRRRGGHGSKIVLVVVVVFLAWAAWFPLSKGVVAPGVVVVDSKRKTVQHLDGGVIRRIHVKDGETVKAGAVLLELDDTKTRSERDVLRSRYYTRLANVDRLRDLMAGKVMITFDPELMEQQGDPQVAQIVATQTESFRVLRREQEGKLTISRQRAGQLQEKLKGLRSYQAATQSQVDILNKEIQRLTGLLAQQLIESSVYSDRMQQLSVHQGSMGKTAADIAETEVAIGEANLSSLQIDREWQQRLSTEMADSQASLAELRSQLTAAESALERSTVKAPSDGVVLGLKATTLGGVVAPGGFLMDIVPADDVLVIEAKVRPIDVDAVKKGTPVHVKFTSFTAKTTPDLNGKIESVSADVLADQAAQAEPYYLMRAAIPGDQLSKLEGQQVVPGMPAEVYVDGGSRTLLQYLAEPLTGVIRKSLRE